MSARKAARLAKLGYRVFPVGEDRAPRTANGCYDATTDPDQIREWWRKMPSAGVGIATGDGLVVVDLDVKNGKDGIAEFTRWAAANGIDWRATTDTPSGGQHVYFRTPDDYTNTVGKVLPGVDVRSAGGYVVAYDAVPPLEELPQVAPTLARLLRPKDVEQDSSAFQRHVGPEGVRAAVEAEVFYLTVTEEGGRNDQLNKSAYNLGQLVGPYLTPDEVREALTQAALEAGMDEREDNISGTLESGLADGMANPRDTEEEPPARGAWTPVDVMALLDGGLDPLTPTLLARTDGLCLLYPGRTHSVSGESGSGKSWLAQWAATEALRAGEWALYLDYESSAASVVARLRSLGCTRDDLSRLVYVNPDAAPRGAEFEELLERRYALAVVDGVTEALGLSGLSGDNLTNSNDAVTRWHAMLPKRIATATGAAVLQVDHVTKAKDNRGGYAIGGQAKRASITGAAYVVTPGRASAGGARGALTCTSVRTARAGCSVRSTGKTWPLGGTWPGCWWSARGTAFSWCYRPTPY